MWQIGIYLVHDGISLLDVLKGCCSQISALLLLWSGGEESHNVGVEFICCKFTGQPCFNIGRFSLFFWAEWWPQAFVWTLPLLLKGGGEKIDKICATNLLTSDCSFLPISHHLHTLKQAKVYSSRSKSSSSLSASLWRSSSSSETPPPPPPPSSSSSSPFLKPFLVALEFCIKWSFNW